MLRFAKSLKNKGFLILGGVKYGLQTDSKSVVPSRVPRVQIPISPPY